MAVSKEKKSEILKGLKERLEGAKIVIFVNFHGLNTALAKEVRKLMASAEAKYLVAKKTLIKKALDNFKFSGQMPDILGEVALIIGRGEAIAPVKSLSKFAKAHPELVLLGGIFENSFVDKKVLAAIAKLPGREVLLAQLLRVINAPKQQMVGALQGPIRNFINVLRQISAKGGSA